MEEAQKPYENIKIRSKNSEAEITGEIPWEVVAGHREDILEEMREEFTAPGFRKGKVPMDIFLKNVREDHVLEDAAERTLQDAYPQIINDHKLEVLGRPEVAVTKLATGNPLGFKITVGLVPEVKLPNYKKIAKEVVATEEPVIVAEAEIEKVLEDLRNLRASAATADKNANDKVPEIDDAFVKTLGNFENVADFKTKLAENLKAEKETARKNERREKIAEALNEETKIALPENLLNAEAELVQERLEEDLQRAKISLEDYLAKVKKTKEELIAEHRGHTERQLKTRFILEAIAKAEDIKADPLELGAEVRYLRSKYPDTDQASLERYAETMLRNERVLKFLEEGEKAAESST